MAAMFVAKESRAAGKRVKRTEISKKCDLKGNGMLCLICNISCRYVLCQHVIFVCSLVYINNIGIMCGM